MKKISCIIIFLLFYPIYINYMYYNNEDEIHTMYVKVEKDYFKVLKINSKLLKNIKYIDNEYNIEGVSYCTLYFSNSKYIGYEISNIEKQRIRLLKSLNKIYSYKLYAISKAVLLNDKSLLDNKLSNDIKKIGASHILAISGLHLSILYYFLYNILFFLREKQKYIVILLLISVYVVIVGFVPSVTRAYTMLLLIIIAKLYDNSISSKKAYLISLIFNLIYHPYQILEVSFIFSYLSTFIIIFFKNNNIIIKNLVLQFALMPLTYIYFKELYLYSFITNIILLPFFSMFVYMLIFISIFNLPFLVFILEQYCIFIIRLISLLVFFFTKK